LGHEERFPPPRLNDRYGFSKETVAITTDNEEHAPKTVVGAPLANGPDLVEAVEKRVSRSPTRNGRLRR